MDFPRQVPTPTEWRQEPSKSEDRKSPYLPAPRGETLPSITSLDVEKLQHEKADYIQQQKQLQQTLASTIGLSAPPLTSPSIYSGPPPPYSYPSSTATSVAGITGYASPPDSRKTSDDDTHEPRTPSQVPRQSLPSISEAIGNAPVLQPSQSSQGTNYPPTSAPNFPAHSNTISRPYSQTVYSGPPNPFSQPQLPNFHERRPPPLFTSHSAIESVNRFSAANANGPTLYPSPSSNGPHLNSPRQATRTYPEPRQSPSYPPSQSRSSHLNKHTSSAPRPSYATNYPSTSRSMNSPILSSYPSSKPSSSPWLAEKPDFDPKSSKSMPQAPENFGKIVKRQLEVFDLEMSLQEIVESSEKTLDWARSYRNHAQQHQRSGPSALYIPSMGDWDEMHDAQTRAMDALNCIRGVIVTQQQMLSERTRQEASKAPSDYGDDGQAGSDQAEGGGGFAGGDPKKRRGKNAAPGRCHSCNRAETPEWRRGPDGARTLCNACGLHFAKLQRKNKNNAAVGGSNLRPKGPAQGSP
ncbi:hypothetical protein MMC25_000315 [Agyrium rufum]|nr:hypothetical protein [Agyrium rufum]